MKGTMQTLGWPQHCIRGQQRGQHAQHPQDKGGQTRLLAKNPPVMCIC